MLVERGREEAVLANLLDEARLGHGGLALIEGVAGCGKTALLSLSAKLGSERKLRVLRGRGFEIDRESPLALLRGLIEPLLDELSPAIRAAALHGSAGELIGAFGRSDHHPASAGQLREASSRLMARLAAAQPLVLLVDDLQWGDPASVAALVAIAHRIDELPAALVLALGPSDDDQSQGLLAELDGGENVRLHPEPLTVDGVGTLLRHHVGAALVDQATAAAALDATGGNPFLVIQLAAALADAGRPLEGRELTDLGKGVSLGLSSVLRMRVGRLGRDAVAVAQAVVVLGDESTIAEVCRVAGLSRDAGLRAAAALSRTGIFARDRVMSFAHPIVRAAIDADMVAADRARLEERAVSAMLDAEASVHRVAEHLLRTDPGSDPRAVFALRAAANAASSAASPARAAVLLRRAMAELPRWPQEPWLLDAVIAAELRAGDFEQVVAHLRERLAGDVTPDERANLVKWLGRVVMQTKGIPAAAALLDAEMESLEGDGRLDVEAEQASMFMLHPPLAGRLPALFERFAGLGGNTRGERAMLAVVGAAMSFAPGQSAAVVAPIVARAFGDGALLADDIPGNPLYVTTAYAIVLTDQFELAEREMSRAARAAREAGSGSGLALSLTIRGMTRLLLGRLGDAEADGLAAIEAGGASPGSLHALLVAQAVGVVVEARVERGDDEGAMRTLTDNGFVGDLGADPALRVLISRARAHLEGGRPAAALADARRRQTGFGGHEDVLSHSAPIESIAHLALGDRVAAIATAEAHLRRARAWGTRTTVAAALRVNGLARGGADGLAMLEEAVELAIDAPAAIEAARCQVALGMLQRRLGHRAAALATLRAGADRADRLGARLIARTALAELLVLGARPRRLAMSGALALTGAERRTAVLAAEGRSNRDIAQELYVSLKTVETHLGRTYRKLDIQSRTQLASALGS